jgi:hypothetical protein
VNTDQIKEALNANAEEFVRWLLPAGRKHGDRWIVGSVCGEAGKSLSVCIAGPRVGMFCDFATSERGSNLIALYLQARSVPFAEGMRRCEEWLLGSLSSRKELVNATKGDKRVISYGPSESAPINAIPDFALAQWSEGIDYLFSNPIVTEELGLSRGWPTDFTFHAIETGLISMPRYGAVRGIAFQVVAPEIEKGRMVKKLIGYHIRLGGRLQGERPAWRYVPNESRHGQRTPALPMILGDFESAKLLVITEGEWDALTFGLAARWLGEGCDWPKGIGLIGIRGASSVNVFLRYYRPFWPVGVNCLVVADADQAGRRWYSGTDSFATKLSAISRKVAVVDCAPHKDFNELYWRASLSSDDIAELLASCGMASQAQAFHERHNR